MSAIAFQQIDWTNIEWLNFQAKPLEWSSFVPIKRFEMLRFKEDPLSISN